MENKIVCTSDWENSVGWKLEKYINQNDLLVCIEKKRKERYFLYKKLKREKNHPMREENPVSENEWNGLAKQRGIYCTSHEMGIIITTLHPGEQSREVK